MNAKSARQLIWMGKNPALAGALLLLALLAARALGSATPERVYVLGREFGWGCLFRRLYGLPCPGCGLTRSVLLTLDGQLSSALGVNPAGPLVVFGLVSFGASLVALALYRQARSAASTGLFARRIRQSCRAYGALVAAVLVVHWLAELFTP